ncbi:hypothetical protein GCK32_009129 [Trichostrongylus colubriformis]|uniref:Uncharacterized protein n=1 Tax=Trichostrongylus colubriformis TaxID=6319 RepID=A0AAN8FR15_TRICO
MECLPSHLGLAAFEGVAISLQVKSQVSLLWREALCKCEVGITSGNSVLPTRIPVSTGRAGSSIATTDKAILVGIPFRVCRRVVLLRLLLHPSVDG